MDTVQHNKINAEEYRKLIINAAQCLEDNKDEINELNVFPVPDGDTGSNMSMTVGHAAEELLKNKDASIEEVAVKTAKAMLHGARGNSGVIISLLFRGIAKGLENSTECDGVAWAKALQFGVEAAYKSVDRPAEGTILTVARCCADAAAQAAKEENSFEYVLSAAIKEAEKALAMAKLMRAEGLSAQAVVAFPAGQQVKTIRNIAEYMVLSGGKLYSVRTLGESLLKWRTSQYSIFDLAGNAIEMQPTDTEITMTGNVTLSAKKVSQDFEYNVTPLRGNDNSRKYVKEEKVSENSGYITYTLPSPATGCVDKWSITRLNKERTAPFAIPYTVSEKNEYIISLNGVKSVTKNASKSVKNSVGCVSISIVNEDGKIVIRRSIELYTDIIPAAKYKEFYEIMRLWNNPAYRKVIARK